MTILVLGSNTDDHAMTAGKKTDTTPLPFQIPEGTPFSTDIDHALRKGFRHFFRRLPTHLSDYHLLCNTLQSLSIDVLQGHGLRDILRDMRRGKSEWDPDERREIGGLKGLARNAAFQLVYYLLMVAGGGDAMEQNSGFNATSFVVSHKGIFKYRTRGMVREAFEDRFSVSDKQRKMLDGWPVGGEEECGEDVTTEEEYFFDSDWSDGF